MPRVPQYQRQVGTAPLPGARINPSAPAEAFGRTSAPLPDLTGALKAGAELVAVERDKADRVAILDADNQLDTAQRAIEAQAKQRRGKDALGATEAALEAWDRETSRVLQGLGGERQRAAIEQRRAQRRQQLAAGLDAYADREHAEYRTGVFASGLKNRVDAAIRATTPDERKAAILEGESLLMTFGRDEGWDPETVKQQRRAFATQVHVGVIGALRTAGDDQGAAAYLAAHEGEIDAEVAAKLKEGVAQDTLLGEAQRRADAILAGAADSGAAYEAAKQIADPKLRAATEQELEVQLARRKRAAAEAYEAVFTQAADLVEKGGVLRGPLREALKPEHRRELDRWRQDRAGGVATTTDPVAYYGLYDLASSSDPAVRQQFADANLLAFRARLSDSDFQEMVKLQMKVRRGDAEADVELATARDEREIIEGALTEAGLSVPTGPGIAAKKKDEAKVRIALFRRAVRDQLQRLQTTSGRKATAEEVQQVVDNLIVRGIVAGQQQERRVFERRPGERLILTIQDVPAMERARIGDSLRRRGLAVTDAAIVNAFAEYVARVPAYAAPETP